MRVLVVAAHPDDEALGCGGTIARHVRVGDEVSATFMTDGVGARVATDPGEALERMAEGRSRSLAAKQAARILGVASVDWIDLPDNQMDSVPLLAVVKVVAHAVSALQPDIIYTHHGGDLNIDHRITHQAVMTACRPMPGSSVKAIYAFEVPSSTEWAPESMQPFRPNHFVDISATLDAKLDALAAYEEEMRAFPHARSIEAVRALAAWRGASVGLKAAEAFMTLRRIEA
jgi:LmbE family N-acetylglucosaminyl deacetylase